MAEHKYVSLKDVLDGSPVPELESTEPNLEPALSNNSRNPSLLPSPPPLSLGGSSSSINAEGRMTTRDAVEKKSLRRARFFSLRLSRSDDPLVYVGCEEDAGGFDDLNTLSKEMKNFSWEERAMRSSTSFESEEEKEK